MSEKLSSGTNNPKQTNNKSKTNKQNKEKFTKKKILAYKEIIQSWIKMFNEVQSAFRFVKLFKSTCRLLYALYICKFC